MTHCFSPPTKLTMMKTLLQAGGQEVGVHYFLSPQSSFTISHQKASVFHIHSKCKLKRLNSWWMSANIWAPFSTHPTHRTEGLPHIHQTEYWGSCGPHTSSFLEQRFHFGRGKPRKLEDTDPLSLKFYQGKKKSI